MGDKPKIAILGDNSPIKDPTALEALKELQKNGHQICHIPRNHNQRLIDAMQMAMSVDATPTVIVIKPNPPPVIDASDLAAMVKPIPFNAKRRRWEKRFF